MVNVCFYNKNFFFVNVLLNKKKKKKKKKKKINKKKIIEFLYCEKTKIKFKANLRML